jgi:hypothetical protein
VTNDLQADLTADLLSDLSRPAPLPAAAPARPPLPSAPTPAATPELSLTLTPLRWSLPSLDSTERGLGVAVRIGPWRVEVAL